MSNCTAKESDYPMHDVFVPNVVFIPVLNRVLVPWIVASSALVSVYLIYVMYYILEDLCVVCMSTHAVNAALLVLEVVSCTCAVAQEGREKKQD